LREIVWQSLLQLPPGAPAIRRLEESAARAVEHVAVFPWALARFPHRGVDHVGIRWINFNVGATGVFVFGNDLLPGLTTVGRAVDPALFAGAVGVSEDGCDHFVGIAGINHNRGDLLAIVQAGKVRPGLARIGGFVDAVSNREIRAMQALAAAHVNNVRVRRSDSDGANGLCRFVVEDWIPRATVIVGFPYSTVDLCHVEDVWLTRHPGGGACTPAAKRTDHAPVEIVVKSFGNLCWRREC